MSYTRLFYHIVIRTFASKPTLPERPDIEQLYKYANVLISSNGGKLYRINSMSDHLHLALTLPATLSISDFMREFKATTSKAIKSFDGFKLFEKWSEGYACVSHCLENKEKVINYIANQQEHHKKTSFREEYSRFLKDMGFEIDDRDWNR